MPGQARRKRQRGGQSKDYAAWKKEGAKEVIPGSGLKGRDVLPEFRSGYSRRNDHISQKSW